MTTNFAYINSALDDMADGVPPDYWRHLHWGLFEDPEAADDSAARYFAATEAMTERMVAAAEVGDGRRVLDVGCGFGGTLSYIRQRNPGCQLAGINIDLRQLQWAQQMAGGPLALMVGDGCVLPVPDRSMDHVLAVECVFHFPSRKRFLKEASRVLRPGGVLALSDFLVAPGALAEVARSWAALGLGDDNWYGYIAKPVTSAAYARLARAVGLELVLDDDVTARTLPTYPALRRFAREAGTTEGVETFTSLERMSQARDLQYHVLSFRKPQL